LEGRQTSKHTGARHLWQFPGFARPVYDFLSPFKPLVRCAHARHFGIFCWFLVGIIRDPGAGTRTGVCPAVPPPLSSWALIRLRRSGKWDAQAVLTGMAEKVLRSLPPAAEGTLYLSGDTTHKPKRGRQHPLGHVTRHSASAPSTFGFEMVVGVASWDPFRLPMASAAIDPERQGHQNLLCRQMLQDFTPPAWVREVVVIADAGDPANLTLKLIEDLPWPDVVAMPRPRTFTNGRYVRDLVQHLPKALYRRRATYKPEGRRQDDGVLRRHAELHQLGDVTMVLSKTRRNCGPKRVKSIVTNLLDARASVMLSHDAVRWGVARASNERKGGLHVGRRQVSQEADRVERAVVLPVCASLLLVHWYGNEEGACKDWSLFQLKQRCTEAFMQDQMNRVEQKWRRQWRKINHAA
jgi:hypothetical protein